MTDNKKKPIVYIDMDDTMCAFSQAKMHALGEYPEQAYPHAAYGFYAELPPIRGAIDAYKWLVETGRFEVYILTAPSINNPMSYTEKRIWVEKHLGMEAVERLIISPNKGLLKGDFLIDDMNEGRGQESFEGMLLHFGTVNCPDWPAARDLLITHYPAAVSGEL